MKKAYNIFLLCFLLVVFCNVAYGKNEPPQPKPAGPAPNPGLPIDGGIGFLLLSGVVYGAYQLRKKN